MIVRNVFVPNDAETESGITFCFTTDVSSVYYLTLYWSDTAPSLTSDRTDVW